MIWIETLNQFPNENGVDFVQIGIEESLWGECSLFFFPHLLLFSWCYFDELSTVLYRPSIFFNEVDNYILLFFFLFFFFLLVGNCGKRKENKIAFWHWVLGFTQDLLNLDYNVLLLSSIFFSLFGCPTIVAVLMIVGRDMGRGAGEDA